MARRRCPKYGCGNTPMCKRVSFGSAKSSLRYASSQLVLVTRALELRCDLRSGRRYQVCMVAWSASS